MTFTCEEEEGNRFYGRGDLPNHGGIGCSTISTGEAETPALYTEPANRKGLHCAMGRIQATAGGQRIGHYSTNASLSEARDRDAPPETTG